MARFGGKIQRWPLTLSIKEIDLFENQSPKLEIILDGENLQTFYLNDLLSIMSQDT